MKKILISLASICLMLLVACSGSSTSYNPETCAKIKTMVEENKELSESDYNQMIDQMVAACKLLSEKSKSLDADPQAAREFMTSDEGRDLLDYSMGFAIYLETNKAKLPEGCLKKLDEAKAELEKLQS